MWWVVADTQPERFQVLDIPMEDEGRAQQAVQAFESGEWEFPAKRRFYVVRADSRAEAVSKVATLVQVQENEEWLAKKRAAQVNRQHKAS